ncbi:sterol desaturase family protein [Lewinella lacunae]|uniref:Sterol desaturase family protein n=1 Tax=Neolewinella lacunae TaxID=1517758 RepID=A0A923T6L8_9BACT|nr:sterol desaturase family protein [Neolewinella lacunae]
MELTDPLVWGFPCFLALMLGEMAYVHGHDPAPAPAARYAWRDWLASCTLGLGAAAITAALHFASAAVLLYWVYDLCNPATAAGERMNWLGYPALGWAWYTWLLCQLGDDFSYYWRHRFNHTIRFMWAAHLVHHSSTQYNFGTGFRNGWFTVVYKPFYYLWLPAIGFHPAMVLVCLGIESIWLFQLHTTYAPSWGFLERIVNTHRQHQVHHASNLEYLDKNHGGILNIFDRLFGTWQPYDENIPIQFGLVHGPETQHPLRLVAFEYQNIWRDLRGARNWREAWQYVFGEPGWSPDGRTLTVREMRGRERAVKAGGRKRRAGIWLGGQ